MVCAIRRPNKIIHNGTNLPGRGERLNSPKWKMVKKGHRISPSWILCARTTKGKVIIDFSFNPRFRICMNNFGEVGPNSAQLDQSKSEEILVE